MLEEAAQTAMTTEIISRLNVKLYLATQVPKTWILFALIP